MELVPAKTILGRPKDDSWFGNDYNMNLYRGCCHGCIYCDSRSECYHVDDFDRVRIKRDALAILERELQSKRKKGVVGVGAMSDTYNPFEKEEQATRGALKLLERFGFGVALDTKSSLVLRDVDLIQRIARNASANIKITITTADDALSKVIEPYVCVSSERFRAIRELSAAGIFTGVLFTPMLPYITDTEENVMEMVRLAHENGARFIFPMFGVTLRQNQRDYYYQKLDTHFPGLSRKYRNVYRSNYYCASPRANKLRALFQSECRKYRLLYRMEDIVAAYKKKEPVVQQMKLF
ncbi:MAG: radical SAM protein [Christensenella sp.]|uniref:SPL family radical SAM protein n=1 Tax=Christensenella sp. TaxID=1935934 RepID=UPI002B20C3FD|nr:radical SAM protein [Christensenella sp.]MEA5003891.1 radical SAM protein [Christensenella sp.]